MQVRSVGLAKRVRDGDGFKTTYPITVSPTVSKFGEGFDRIQLVVRVGDTKIYTTLRQMREFCENVLELIRLLELGYYLFGEEEVRKAIDKLYERRKTEATQDKPMIIEVNGIKGIVKDGKFIPLENIDIQTV